MPPKTDTTVIQNQDDGLRKNLPDPSQTGFANTAMPQKAPGFISNNALSPQTGTETRELQANGIGLQAYSPQIGLYPQTGNVYDRRLDGGLAITRKITSAPQTDMKLHTDMGTISSIIKTTNSVPNLNNAAPQTGMESDGNGPRSQAQKSEIKPVTHSDLDSGKKSNDSSQPSDLHKDAAILPQTGSEFASQDGQLPARKTRRRARQSQSGGSTENLPEQPVSATPARGRRARPEPVLAIDGQRSVETREDKLRNDLLDLVESQKSRKILTGIIQGVERSSDNPNLSFAVIYHGEFKVIIPAEEAVRPPDNLRGRSPGDVMNYLVTKRLGAEVDYIVKGVDVNSGLAAASRLEAMALKRRQYYFNTDRNGNNLIYEGLIAEARVVSVIRAGIFVDLFGLETYIPLQELNYQRLIDAAAYFQPGERVLIKILKLDRSERDNIQVTASVKQAGENPYEQALKRYTPGNKYVGTVSIVDTAGVFVSLDGGIDCLCSYPNRGRPPRGSRVTIVIIGVNYDTNRIWGAITHISTVR